MNSTVQQRTPRTRRQRTTALLISGLAIGTVGAAGAASLGPELLEGSGPTANLSGQPSGVVSSSAADQERARPSVATPDVSGLGGVPLSELREQSAAGRSQARSAPESAAASEGTLLADSPFTGTTPEVPAAAPVEPVQAPSAAQVEEPEHVHADAQVASQPLEDAEQAAPPQSAQNLQQSTTQSGEPTQPDAPQEPVAVAEPAPTGGSLLDVAASYVGYPYVLYGTPPAAFDCSAYTWWVFQQAGIDIPRTVNGQKSAVTPVSEPQPGDLVIYNDWHHIGIYAGNGMTYEALNPSTDVRYGPLLSDNVWYGRIG